MSKTAPHPVQSTYLIQPLQPQQMSQTAHSPVTADRDHIRGQTVMQGTDHKLIQTMSLSVHSVRYDKFKFKFKLLVAYF